MVKPTDKRKEVKDPKMPINKLGEWLSATNTRRETLLRQQKFPKPGGGAGSHYESACRAIVKYLTTGCDPEVLIAASQQIERRKAETDQAKTKKADNLAAIQHFMRLAEEIRLPDGCEAISGLPNEFTQAVHQIEGVKVNIRPEVLLRFNVKRKPKIGVIKLHFSRNYAFDEQSAKPTAALLEYCLRRSFEKTDDVHSAACMLIDVFAGEVTFAPNAYISTMNEVKASCRTIAAMWPNIQ